MPYKFSSICGVKSSVINEFLKEESRDHGNMLDITGVH